MDDSFPVPLNNERDLDLYERYINSADGGFERSLPQYLSCHIGKPVRVETVILNLLDTKTNNVQSQQELVETHPNHSILQYTLTFYFHFS